MEIDLKDFGFFDMNWVRLKTLNPSLSSTGHLAASCSKPACLQRSTAQQTACAAAAEPHQELHKAAQVAVADRNSQEPRRRRACKPIGQRCGVNHCGTERACMEHIPRLPPVATTTRLSQIRCCSMLCLSSDKTFMQEIFNNQAVLSSSDSGRCASRPFFKGKLVIDTCLPQMSVSNVLPSQVNCCVMSPPHHHALYISLIS